MHELTKLIREDMVPAHRKSCRTAFAVQQLTVIVLLFRKADPAGH